MDEKLASVVIVTRNRKGIVLDCLDSVLKMDYPRFEVIVVDNGSTDGTVEAVRKVLEQVQGDGRLKIVEANENLGLNGGKNLGQKRAKGDYILFLDSDTIVDKNLLTELVRVAESDMRVGIVCPKIYYYEPKNVIWYAGSFVNLWTSQTKNIGCNEVDRGQFDAVCETQFAPTAYLATRKVVDQLEGHDEFLFMTYGDTDYGYRAAKAGFKVMFCPKAKLWHRLTMKENTQSIRRLGYNLPMRAYYFARNRVIFMKSHASLINFFIFMLIFFPAFTFYFTYKIVRFGGGWQFLKPHLQGSFDGLKYAIGLSVTNIYK